MIVKLLTEHHLEFLSLRGGCRGSSESTLVKMPHCWKSHALAHFTELFLTKHWFKTAQMVLLCWTKGPPERYLDKMGLYMASPLEPLFQIKYYFTEMFCIMPSTIIAQMVWKRWTKRLPVLKIRNIFKQYLLNHWSKFRIISHEFPPW